MVAVAARYEPTFPQALAMGPAQPYRLLATRVRPAKITICRKRKVKIPPIAGVMALSVRNVLSALQELNQGNKKGFGSPS